MEDSTSRFNRATKLALQDLKTWMSDDPYPKALCKTYMRLKRSDRREPLRRFAAFWAAAHPSWVRAVTDRTLDGVVGEDALFWTRIPETYHERMWNHADALLDAVRSYEAGEDDDDLSRALSSLDDAVAGNGGGGEGLPNLTEVIHKTTELMPQVFQQLGMDVSPDEVQKAAAHLQSSHMMSMLKRMMSSSGMAGILTSDIGSRR